VLKDSKGYKKLQAGHWINAVLVSLLTLVVICIVILASVPPVSRDALIHHLALPKLYLKHGGIYEIPSLKFSYYPMNLDLLYMIPLYFGNDIVPKFIHFGFALLTGGFIFLYLKKRTALPYAFLGVLLFLSIPVIVKLSTTVYVDLGLIFFSFAALIYLFKWLETGFKWKSLAASAICCGLALGTKYNALISFFLLTLFIVFIYSRMSAPIHGKQIKALAYGAAFMLIAAAVFSPWAIRNFKWTNNPLYPLYNSWFNPHATEFQDVARPPVEQNSNEDPHAEIQPPKGRYTHFAIRKIVFNEKWWEIALIPFRIFFQGEDDNPKYFDGRLNPLLFFLPIFAFLHCRKDPSQLKTEKKILLAFSILFILYAFFLTDMRIRYMSPAIPPLVILSMLGFNDLIHTINDRFSGQVQKIALIFTHLSLGFLLCLNAAYIYQQFNYISPLDFISGRLSRDAYIERYRSEYAAIQFANKAVPEHGIILGIFLGDRSYYSNRAMVFHYKKFFLNTIQQGLSSTEVVAILKNAGITHLIIRYDLFARWVENNFNERQKDVLRQVLNERMDLIFSKSGHGVFQLHPV
jgi:hypothetical protein